MIPIGPVLQGLGCQKVLNQSLEPSSLERCENYTQNIESSDGTKAIILLGLVGSKGI